MLGTVLTMAPSTTNVTSCVVGDISNDAFQVTDPGWGPLVSDNYCLTWRFAAHDGATRAALAIRDNVALLVP